MDLNETSFKSMTRKSGTGAFCGLFLVVALVCAPLQSALAKNDALGTAKEGGLGMAAAVSSLVYGPSKVVYAIGGTFISGFAWVFSGGDSEVAGTVLTRAVRGTYVISPETLTGEKEIEFVGRSPEYRTNAPRQQVASAPDGW
jgi:hypothetical protein